MNIKCCLKVMFLLLIFLFGGAGLRAENLNSPEIFRAAGVARQDFSLRLNKDSGTTWKYAAYVANISNYNIGISENDDCYIVVFLLKKTTVKINGGGGEYKIRKGNLKIIHFLGYS